MEVKSDEKEKVALLSTETVMEYSFPSSKFPVKSSHPLPFLTLQKMELEGIFSRLPSISGVTVIPLVVGASPTLGGVTPVIVTDEIAPAAYATTGSHPAIKKRASVNVKNLLVIIFSVFEVKIVAYSSPKTLQRKTIKKRGLNYFVYVLFWYRQTPEPLKRVKAHAIADVNIRLLLLKPL